MGSYHTFRAERRIDKALPACGWKLVLLRASSPRLYHTHIQFVILVPHVRSMLSSDPTSR